MLLSQLLNGQEAIITKVNGSGAFRKRILEMGFVKGKTVKAILNAPLKDPVKYQILNYEVSLRRSEAALIEIIPLDKQQTEQQQTETIPAPCPISQNIDADSTHLTKTLPSHNKSTSSPHIHVALVGNPNTGKTSLFNFSSGLNEHVGNYSGVTVSTKEGHFKHKGYEITLVDLPGTYSISAYSPEELFVRKQILENRVDIIINVVAASNIERNLYLTTELLEMNPRMIMALNMYDELQHSGNKLDHELLSNLLSLPIIPTNSRTGEGINTLLDTVVEMFQKQHPTSATTVYYGNTAENAISKLRIALDQAGAKANTLPFPQRYFATKLLEKDSQIEEFISQTNYHQQVIPLRNQLVEQMESLQEEDSETTFTNARYGFVSGALAQTFTPAHNPNTQLQTTSLIDRVITHKYWGFPIFLLFMWIMFECTFRIGAYPMEWIENGVEWLNNFIAQYMPEGMLKDLILDGVVGGVGGVIVFLPNIVILYAFISFMEDSGYMSRAAFVMDKIMHKMGLHGKSFIPLVMGFGCNVPAVMATRTIESRNSRMITMLITPFMSCSARIPIYILFAGTFFPHHAGIVLFGLYITGVLLAFVSAILFRKILFKGQDTPFVMELPPYRIPTAKSVMLHMWEKSKLYLQKMGGIILIASIIIWFLGYFPLHTDKQIELDERIEQLEQQLHSGNISQEDYDSQTEELEAEHAQFTQENSYIGRLGHWIEPVMRPLGFDWRISISILSAMPAKEIAVSTLGVIFAGETDADEESTSLRERLQQDVQPDGTPTFTPLTVISLLLFMLIYFPCIATIVAIKQEGGSWKWGIFSMVYSTALAWIVSFVTYSVGSIFIH